MFKTKYHKKYKEEFKREIELQKIMTKYNCDRVHAVHRYDYNKEMNKQLFWKSASAIIFGFGTVYFAKNKHFNPVVQKKVIQLPIFCVAAYCGTRLWDKLIGHYLNFVDHDVAHDFKINYEHRYKLYEENKLKDSEDFSLKQFNSLKVNFKEDDRSKSIAKLLTKIRNLENIAFVDESDLKKVKNSLELQLLIDSVEPKITKESASEHIKKKQSLLYKYKLMIESMRILESDKEKLLGLPFMIKRLNQFPEPERGSWQYNLFEELFGNPYEEGKYEFETEEKIHKFNYKKFLHPSIIDKFNDDINHPDFDYYIREKNLEMKTRLDKLKENREFFCKNILPDLNLLNDEEKGKEFAYFVMNRKYFTKENNNLIDYYYETYSNQNEEKLFREAEELRLINKNQYVVDTVQSSTIKDEYKGFREKELKELFSNPKKRKDLENAIRAKYNIESPKSIWENYEIERNRKGLIDTAVDEIDDLKTPEINNYENLFNKTYDNPDMSEDEEAAYSYANSFLETTNRNGDNSLPIGKHKIYDRLISNDVNFNDYAIEDKSKHSLLSAKIMRYENDYDNEEKMFINNFTRRYSTAAHKDKEMFIVPHLERNNEDIQDKLFKKRPIDIFNDKNNFYYNEITDIRNFINHKIEQDTAVVSDDVSEEELNEVLFEASYSKDVKETDEYKGLERRNNIELESLFKALKITPNELWNYEKTHEKKILNKRPIYTYSQLSDPLYGLVSEVEQPEVLRKVLKDWRKGAEIRTRMPYYPETKKAGEYFHLI